jgi:recombination DNA repair RAD52 pathway protein
MTEPTKQQEAEAKTVEGKIKTVNQILQQGEPTNISVDTYSGYSGYKPQHIVDALNAVFGIGGWGFIELAAEVVTTPTEKGSASLAVAQVQVWLKGIDFMPVGWGQSRVTKGDVGDAKKGAQTDAIKKALSYFSIGNRAYHGCLRPAEAAGNGQKQKPVRSVSWHTA